ncbi:MFS transporter [Flavobacteriaceae bacterium TP-CH-4]|uniref:MFS transporter n=1 Tax=Pelagihabitans pacificus TaxID=2696054 RepID=A0A967ATX9_9FLAO|nr:MFS transporter [Pelagihabitans pacificus]NHF59949.1 MFS transporter [Pelagihabitans pacificus]
MSKEKTTGPYQNTFFLLFVTATFVSNVGTWLFSVGSGWLMTELDSSAFMVSLVQTATLIPLFVLAIPAGAIGDIYDQKKIIVITQSLLILNTLVFAYIVYLGKASVTLLLVFTLLNGVGAAFSRPIMAALVPRLVQRSHLRTAVNLTGIAYNLSRALGPILGGTLITLYALDMPFWIDGLSFGAVVLVILFWKNDTNDNDLPKQKLTWAMGDSIRFLRYTPALYHSILRAVLFFFPAAALWALMPLIAREQFAGGPDLYGYLLGASGFGAVSSVLFSKVASKTIGTNRLTVLVSCMLGICLLLLGFVASKYVALGICLVAGICWQLAFTNLMTSTQYALPKWYGARGMAYFLMAMSGSLGIGSALWGVFSDETSLTYGLYAAGILSIVIAFIGTRFPLDQAKSGNFTAATDIPELSIPTEGENEGWVLIHIEYALGKVDRQEAINKIRTLRNKRYRSGAIDWKLFSPADRSDTLIESFYEVSLEQYERHREQITQYDREQIEELIAWFKDHQGSVDRKHYLEV